jgi:ArsR family transcriptional regulator
LVTAENHSNEVVEMGALTRIGNCRYVVLVKELTLTAKAFADPTRVRILSALREKELCVCELCDALAVTQSTLSTHLQVIRDARLLSSRKQGKWMYYTIEPSVGRLVDSLFKFFSPSLKSDTTLRRDGKRLRQRLSLRDDGACCVGFAGSKRKC